MIQPKGVRFDHFFKFFLSSKGKMDVFGKFFQARCFRNNFLNVLKNNMMNKSFPNQMFFYIIGKFSKHHIKNGPVFSIWNYELKVMMKRN
jgi:hypothetical protein